MIRVVLDESKAAEARIAAAHVLAAADGEHVLHALLEVARRAEEETAVARAVGEAVAAIHLRTGTLRNASLVDFSGDAYLAFDRYVAEHQ
jgi:hypothetical protein